MTKCVAYQFDFLRFPALVGSYQHHQGIKQTFVCPANSEPAQITSFDNSSLPFCIHCCCISVFAFLSIVFSKNTHEDCSKVKFVYLLHKFFCVVLSFVLLQIQNIDSFRRGSPQLTIGSLLLFPSFFGNFTFLLFYFFFAVFFFTFLQFYYSSFSIFFLQFLISFFPIILQFYKGNVFFLWWWILR